MSKILKNQTASPIIITDVGAVVLPATPGTYTIPPQDYLLWAASSDILTYVNDTSPIPSVIVSDGSVDLNPSDGVDLIKGLYPRTFVFDPVVENIAITLANTEVTHVLPLGTKRFLLKLRHAAILKLSYAVGTSGTIYSTLPSGAWYSEDRIGAGTTTLYFQSTSASQIAEITSWS